MDELSTKFTAQLGSMPWVYEAKSLVSARANGSEYYLMGGFVRRMLIMMLHGWGGPKNESDFLLIGEYDGSRKPEGWGYAESRFGMHVYSKPNHCARVLPIGTFPGIKSGSYALNLGGFFESMSFRHQAVVYDFKSSTLLGPGIDSIRDGELIFNNVAALERAKRKGIAGLRKMVNEELQKTGFKFRLEKDKL